VITNLCLVSLIYFGPLQTVSLSKFLILKSKRALSYKYCCIMGFSRSTAAIYRNMTTSTVMARRGFLSHGRLVVADAMVVSRLDGDMSSI
jgi:hypothetical protein